MHADKFNIPDFLNLQLAFISERLSPEEQMRVEWWKQRIQSLTEHEPERNPRSQPLGKAPLRERIFQ